MKTEKEPVTRLTYMVTGVEFGIHPKKIKKQKTKKKIYFLFTFFTYCLLKMFSIVKVRILE